MADIELVIRIPKETYEYWKEHKHESVLAEAIANGIPLPKRHGDLIDKSKIKTVELENSLHYMHWEQGSEVDLSIEARTIIPSNKER